MAHRIIRGSILYTSKKPERLDQERGREHFVLTKQADRSEVLLAHCEIDDAPNVIRDVSLAMNCDGSPIDCSVRLTVGDKFEGSAWMRFADGYAECESYNAKSGRESQRIETDKKVQWLHPHSIICDAQIMRLFDLSKGSGRQKFSNVLLTSPDHRGATGPKFFVLSNIDLIYVGDEQINVAAGEFSARHFQLAGTEVSLPEEHPPYDVWCTADDDYIFLKGQVGGYMQTYYELTNLVRPI